MGLVNMNLLNYLWETGIKPIKNAIAEKLDSSKAANNLLTTEEGFYLDARQGPEIMSMIEEQNSNLSELSGSLADKSGLNAANRYTKPQAIFCNNGISANAYNNSPLQIVSTYNNANWSRAQIAFHNAGANAAILYLDVDGRLKICDNSGNIHVLAYQ